LVVANHWKYIIRDKISSEIHSDFSNLKYYMKSITSFLPYKNYHYKVKRYESLFEMSRKIFS